MKNVSKKIWMLGSMVLFTACNVQTAEHGMNCLTYIASDQSVLYFDTAYIQNSKARIVIDGATRIDECNPTGVTPGTMGSYVLDREPTAVKSGLITLYGTLPNPTPLIQQSFELWTRPDCSTAEVLVGTTALTTLNFQTVSTDLSSDAGSCTKSVKVAYGFVSF